MTTTVIVNAHCGDDKEVSIIIDGGEIGQEIILQDGETSDNVVYDERQIIVKERIKT